MKLVNEFCQDGIWNIFDFLGRHDDAPLMFLLLDLRNHAAVACLSLSFSVICLLMHFAGPDPDYVIFY